MPNWLWRRCRQHCLFTRYEGHSSVTAVPADVRSSVRSVLGFSTSRLGCAEATLAGPAAIHSLSAVLVIPRGTTVVV